MDYEKMYKAVLKTATQWIKDGCSDKEKICLESIFPELRESEDERIRKEIIDFIQWAEDRGMTRHDYHQAKRPAVWIAYLEKQKECVADSSKTSANEDESIRKFLVDYFTSYKIGNVTTKLNGVRIDDILNYLKRQKENANSFTDGVIEVRSFQRGIEEGRKLETQKEPGIKWLKSDDVKNPDKPYVDKAGMFYTTDGRMCYASEIEQQKEQKPVEYLSKDKVYAIMSKLTKLSTSNLISFNSPEYKKINEITSDIRSLLDYPIEQKPAEWDDYTKTNLGRAIQIIKDARGTLHGYQTDDGIYECDKAIEALEHFLYRGLEIEKPAEWSEEDEEMLNSCISSIEESKENRYAYKENDGDTSYDKEIAWLKSLRPVSKESLQPHWKPSEEQMEALRVTIDFMPDTFKPRCTLITLQNGLEKLMSL